MSASARPHVRALPAPVRVAGDPLAHPGRERTRDALALRCQRLEETRPDVLEVAADALTALREALHGRASEAAGNHAPQYWRAVLRGEHAATVEDLARLALDEPAAAAAGVGVLAVEAGYQLEPIPDGAASIGQTGAAVAESGGRVTSELVGALADGCVDSAEEAALSASIERHKLHVAALEAALSRIRRAR